jgi:hypothetical protein
MGLHATIQSLLQLGKLRDDRDERSEMGKHLSIGRSLNDRLKPISSAFAEATSVATADTFTLAISSTDLEDDSLLALVLAPASGDSA